MCVCSRSSGGGLFISVPSKTQNQPTERGGGLASTFMGSYVQAGRNQGGVGGAGVVWCVCLAPGKLGHRCAGDPECPAAAARQDHDSTAPAFKLKCYCCCACRRPMLQIDAHMTFAAGWDAELLRMIKSVPSKKPLITVRREPCAGLGRRTGRVRRARVRVVARTWARLRCCCSHDFTKRLDDSNTKRRTPRKRLSCPARWPRPAPPAGLHRRTPPRTRTPAARTCRSPAAPRG